MAKRKVILLPSTDGQDHLVPILVDENWNQRMQLCLTIERVHQSRPGTWTFEDMRAALEAAGYEIPEFEMGPYWDRG